MKYYNDHTKAADIFKANLDKLEHADRIYVGQSLRIPQL
jgi:nucleoid-associated protein YgaU